VLLVIAVWLLAMRSSSREAHRFGDAARVLSLESQRLEERLHRINRELSMARDFLTTQSRELEFLGRSASERISEHAGRLQELVHDNGAQVDAIASVSTTAMENMAKLRDNLPVIATSARDISNQIGSAGRTATAQLDELVSGFARLNEFGDASERQVGSLRERIDGALDDLAARLDHIEAAATDRFTILRTDSEAFRTELDTREIDALAHIRTRADRLAERDERTCAGPARKRRHRPRGSARKGSGYCATTLRPPLERSAMARKRHWRHGAARSMHCTSG
jgi:ElaB/YqjD/DUF883 family membrane-anchored ribosome-binding protein